MQEQDAIRLLKQGDLSGLDLLVHQYQYRAVRSAMLVVRDYSTAEDIVQSAFLRVITSIQQFDSRRPFGPWFLRIVLNDALKEAQRRERYTPLSSPEEGSPTPLDLLSAEDCEPELLLELGETRESVTQALNQLTPLQRAAIVQRYYLGMSEADMAQRASTTPGAVKLRLFGARERLRKLLQPLRNGHSR